MRRMVTTSELPRKGDLGLLSGQRSLDHEVPPLRQAQTNAQAVYEDTLGKIRSQLMLRFHSPDDPLLIVRRQELIRLFKLVPAQFAKALYNQLQNHADPLSRLFRGALAPITCTVLLRELQKKMASNVPSGPGPLEPDAQTFVLGLVARGVPLPAALEPQFREAADRFISLMLQNVFDGKLDPAPAETLICILNLIVSGADDKVVLLGERCSIGQLMRNPGSMCVQPVMMFLITHKDIQSQYTSLSKYQLLSPFTHHLKPILFNIHLVDSSDDVLALLLQLIEKLQREFDYTAQSMAQLFGNTSPLQRNNYHPSLFRINSFVEARRNDPNSIYSCLN